MGWDVVVAIEFQIVEGGGDAEPAGHGGGFKAGDARFADDHYVAAAHGTADQDDFQFDWRAESQLARAKEKDAGGADVARHQGDGEIFGAAGNTTKTEWKAQRSSGVFALFGKDTDGVSRHASKPAHRIHRLQRHHAQRWYARITDCGRKGWRRSGWSCGDGQSRDRLRSARGNLTHGNG